MRNRLCFTLVLLACGFSGNTPAQNIDELTRIQNETAVTEAKIKLAKAQKELDATERETGTPLAPTLPGGNVVSGTSMMGSPYPVMKTVFGERGRIKATFICAGGIEVVAGVGDELPDGYRVDAISVDKATVSRKGRKTIIGFASAHSSSGIPDMNTNLPGTMSFPPSPAAIPASIAPVE